MHVSTLLWAILGPSLFATALSDALGQEPIRPTRGDGSVLTLSAVVTRALATHPRILAAAEAVRAAEGARRTSRSWTNPMLSYQLENSAFPGQAAPVGIEREAWTGVTFPIEPLYQLRSRGARADAEVRAAEADLRSMRRDVAMQAVSAFYSAATAQVTADALRDVGRWLDSLVVYTRTRVGEGAAAEVDLIRLEVERGRTETDRAMADVDVARARAELATLIGVDSFRIEPENAARLPLTAGAIPSVDNLLSLARNRRSDLQAGDARIAAARAGVALERSAVVREIGVMTGMKSMAGTRSFMAGLNVALPLFDQNRGEIQRADAERRIAGFDREQIERQIRAEVTASYAAVRNLSEQVSRIDNLLPRAEEARRIAEGAYREGVTSLIQVLDAARALAEARQVYYRAAFARLESIVALNAAIGSDDLTTLVVNGGNR